MTNQEAISYLQQLYPNGGHCWLDEQRIEALGMAIDALQEEPVSIWHDANQPPEIYSNILVRTYDNIVESTKRYDDNLIPWEDRIKRDDITHWCYVEDLLKL